MKSPASWAKQTVRRLVIGNHRRAQQLGKLGHLGRPALIARSASFRHHAGISIGKFARVGPDCVLDGEGGLEIGPGVIFASNVVVLTSTHEYEQSEYLPYDLGNDLRPVKIGAGTWIGWGAYVCPGVTIGVGAVVAMGSVVVNDVADGEIVGGNPARVLRQRDASIDLDRLVEHEQFYLRNVIENGAVRAGRPPVPLDDLIA